MLLNSANQLNLGPPQPASAPVPQSIAPPPQALIPSVQDYTVQVLNAPKYVYKQRPTTTGNSSATITPNAVNTQVVFEIPVGVINFSRFRLHYDWFQNGQLFATYVNVAGNQVPYLAAMRLVANNTSTAIQEVNNLQKWSSSVRLLETDTQAYMSMDAMGYRQAYNNAGAAPVGFQANGGMDCLGPHKRDLLVDITAGGSASVYAARYDTAVAAAPVGAQIAGVPHNDVTESMIGQRYVIQSAVSAGGGAVGIGSTTDISFGQLFPKNTSFFGMDIDTYFPTVMYLQLQFGPGNLTAWNSTAANQPGACAVAANGGALGAGQNAALSNINLYMAVQSNESLANRTIAKVKANLFKLPIPYVYVQRIQPGGSTQTIQQRFDGTFGALLKTIYTTIWNGTEQSNMAQQRNNSDGFMIQQFYETINSNRITDFNVDCRNGQGAAANVRGQSSNTAYPNLDWSQMKPWLARSPLGISPSVYQYNWIYKTDFSGMAAAGKQGAHSDNNIVGGLNIFNQAQLYSLQATMGDYVTNVAFAAYAAPIWYQWYICQKMLVIAPSGETKVV